MPNIAEWTNNSKSICNGGSWIYVYLFHHSFLPFRPRHCLYHRSIFCVSFQNMVGVSVVDCDIGGDIVGGSSGLFDGDHHIPTVTQKGFVRVGIIASIARDLYLIAKCYFNDIRG